jgi:hypothetical protein
MLRRTHQVRMVINIKVAAALGLDVARTLLVSVEEGIA